MVIEVPGILFAGAIYLISLALLYFFTTRHANSKIDNFKTLSEAVAETQAELSAAQDLLEQANGAYQRIDSETKALQALRKKEQDLAESVRASMQKVALISKEIQRLEKDSELKSASLHELLAKLDLYGRIEEFVDYGHFEMPEYLYETSERFAEEIKLVREKQKSFIKEKKAVQYPETTIVSDDAAVNRKILSGQAKLMLTAFNIECDKLIGKVKPSTFSATLERIENLANALEKSTASLTCGFNLEYVRTKFEECRLQYQYTLKKKDEIEEQRAIREQIREEQRAVKEYEKAVAEAEKEEKLYRELLEKARQELGTISEEERALAEAKIAALEQQLSEAEAKEARAKSMAEQTRKGHVYIISNIGSFGEDIYKIGLTRRLEPMDRVKELGDASVPFSFDVHAMIYVDDAPALETALHREFNDQRVNRVNYRKEFFHVSLDQIRHAAERLAGVEPEFKLTIAAEEYYESQRLRGSREYAVAEDGAKTH